MDQSVRPVSVAGAPGATGDRSLWPTVADGKGSGAHMRSPFHRWPHQHRPSALMMQVPEPQQRVSSMVGLSWVIGVAKANAVAESSS